LKVEDLFWGKGPKLHLAGGVARSWQINDQALAYIDTQVTRDSRTLETGAGVSTILFALKGCSHTCIAPFPDEVDRIKAFCAENGIAHDRVTFVVEKSEVALPGLSAEALDLVLIDGGHGFPIPIIDWWFTANRLRVGGILVLDDIGIWSVNVLKQFLADEPGWQLERDMWPKSAVFSKIDVLQYPREFKQPFVLKETIKLLTPDHIDMIRPYVSPELVGEK
jgi:methyltransferase family protein